MVRRTSSASGPKRAFRTDQQDVCFGPEADMRSRNVCANPKAGDKPSHQTLVAKKLVYLFGSSVSSAINGRWSEPKSGNTRIPQILKCRVQKT